MFQKTAHDCWCLFGRNSTFALWDQIITVPKTPQSSPSSTAHHTHSFQSLKALKLGQDRLSAEQIRQHPFFKGLDFKKLRKMAAPIKPVVPLTKG